MSNQGYVRNPYWAPEFTGQKPSFNNMGAFSLNPAHPLNQGLVAWWLGDSLYDISGKYRLSVVGTAADAIVTPVGFYFNGLSAAYYRLPYASSFTSPQITVIASGIPTAALDVNLGIGAIDGEYGSTRNYVYLDSAGATAIRYSLGGTSRSLSATIALNAEYYYGVMYDGTNERGIFSGQLDTGSALASLVGNTEYSITIGQSGGGAKSTGYITSVAQWNRALTRGEVLQYCLYPYGTPSNPRLIVEPRYAAWRSTGGGEPPSFKSYWIPKKLRIIGGGLNVS